MRNTLVFRNPNKGEAEVQPYKLPAKLEVVFSGPGQAFYGTDGGPANQPLIPNQPTIVVVNINTMHLSWSTEGEAKLQWKD